MAPEVKDPVAQAKQNILQSFNGLDQGKMRKGT